jgi:hypothetical protein
MNFKRVSVNAGFSRALATARFFLFASLFGLAACSTTGRNFDASALNLLVPGQTTLEQASALLGADPVDTYRQLDGSATARWAHKATLATDAIYFNRELWLAFGPDGRYQRVVESINIPRVYQARAVRTNPPAPQAAPIAPISGGMDATVVTYPLLLCFCCLFYRWSWIWSTPLPIRVIQKIV